MAKGDSSGPSGQPQAPKIDQYSVMHRLMDQMGSSDNAMAPSPQMGGRFNSQPLPRDVSSGSSYGTFQPSVEPIGNIMNPAPNSLAPEGAQDMIRRRMMSMNTYGNQ